MIRPAFKVLFREPSPIDINRQIVSVSYFYTDTGHRFIFDFDAREVRVSDKHGILYTRHNVHSVESVDIHV